MQQCIPKNAKSSHVYDYSPYLSCLFVRYTLVDDSIFDCSHAFPTWKRKMLSRYQERGDSIDAPTDHLVSRHCGVSHFGSSGSLPQDVTRSTRHRTVRSTQTSSRLAAVRLFKGRKRHALSGLRATGSNL